MKHRFGLILLALLTITTGGCAKKVDLDAARTAIRTADAEWSKAASSKDAAAFAAAVDPSGSVLPPNQPTLSASDVQNWASTMMSDPGFSVSWQSTTVDVAASGELGYTVGTYELSMQGPGGTPMTDHGKYVTIWKKQADGSWKSLVDTFNSDVPMPASAPADTMDMNAK